MIYELRVYHCAPGRLPALLKRFETTTLGIWSFTKAFSSNSFGQGAAVAIVSVLLLLVLTFAYVRRLVRSGEEL